LPKTTIAERAFDCLDAPIVRVAAPDVPAIPAAEALEQFYMPNLDKIVVALNRVLQY
jgi:2-oxoisovalerate dehydrogenase E1 component beta subunit